MRTSIRNDLCQSIRRSTLLAATFALCLARGWAQPSGSLVYTSDRLGLPVTIESVLASCRLYALPGSTIVDERSFGTVTTLDVSEDGARVLFSAVPAGSPNANDIWAVDHDGRHLFNVTNNGMGAGHPDLSPDGTTIVFCTNWYDLYTVNVDGTNLTHIGRGVTPKWSPDGTKIVYSNWGLTYDSDLFVMDMATRNVVQITQTPGIAEINGQWSPDGSRIACQGLSGGTSAPPDIWVMNADGTDRTNLCATWGASSSESFYSWSPDGSRIGFVSDVAASNDIWVMNADDGGDRVNLTGLGGGFGANESLFAWSPTGDSIAFTSDVSGNNDIWVVKADEPPSLENFAAVTNTSWNESIVAWSPHVAIPNPTGSLIYATTRLSGARSIEVMPAGGGQPRTIVSGGFDTLCGGPPRVSADGSTIVFDGGRVHGNDIWIANSDGTNVRNVTNNGMGAVWPDISPDGTTIVFCTVWYNLYTIKTDGTELTSIGRGVHPRWSRDGTEVIYSNWGITYDSDLFVMDIATGQSRQITDTPGKAEIVGEWSPDGRRILFLAVVNHNQPDENEDIWVMDEDGSNLTNLIGLWGGTSGFPVWSPDGNYIAFMSNASGNADIWIMRSDGTNKQNVTNTDWSEISVAWGPVIASGPRIVSVNPSSGSAGETLDVDVVGANTHFGPLSQVDFGAGTVVNQVTVYNTMELTATLSIAPGASPGSRDVTVTTGSEVAVGEHLFTILGGEPTVPPPAGVTVTAGASSTFLRWNPSPSPRVVGYNVYRDTAQDGTYATKLNDTPITGASFEDSTAIAGVTYYYKVTAVADDGSESAMSEFTFTVAGLIVISMPDIRGNAGESVRLPISLDCAWGVNGSGLEMHIAYDPTLLTPTAVEKTVLTQEFTFVDNVGAADGQIDIAGIGEGTLAGEGHILDIIFDVNPTAALDDAGTFVFVNVVMYDWDLRRLTVDYSDTATFIVSPYFTFGDVSGDGIADVADAILAQRIADGEIQPTPWQLSAGDINGDGVIDCADVTLILRTILGLPINPGELVRSVAQVQTVWLAQTAPRIVSVANASGKPGDTVPVTVGLGDASGLAGCDLTIVFDSTAFEVTNVSASALTNGFALEWYESGGVLNISLAASTALTSGSGNLCEIEFHIRPTATPGDRTLNLAWVKLSGQHGEDISWKSPVTKSSGTFTIEASGAGDGDGGGGACFIATAAYGTPYASQIEPLRTFRDRYLLTNAIGTAIVKAYYGYSPALANAIARNAASRSIVRLLLAPAVAIARVALAAPTAITAAITIIVVVGSFVLIRAGRSGLNRGLVRQE